MKWYYLWRLKRANVRMKAAVDALPEGFGADPVKYVVEIIEFSRAHCEVAYYQNRLRK